MAFKDLDEFFDDSLKLPVGGKTYVIPGPSAETGLWCQRRMIAAQRNKRRQDAGQPIEDDGLDDDEEADLYQRCLGPVYDQMIADDVAWNKIKHCGITAYLWCAGNVVAAEQYWESDPEALARAQNRAARRATAKSGSKRKTVGAAETMTRRRASTSGTKSPVSRGKRS